MIPYSLRKKLPPPIGTRDEDAWIPVGSGRDQGKLHARWIPAADADASTFLYFHGQTHNNSTHPEHAQRLYQLGYNVLMVDYRGLGRSRGGGQPSEAKLYEDAEAAWNFFAADDAARAVAVLADVLSHDRSNRVAAERLLSALTYRNFCLPLTEALRHDGVVYCALFSPDGRRVVTASEDHTARVWDVQTGEPLTNPLRHDEGGCSARFSTDGLRVITTSGATARVWDAQTGKLPLPTPRSATGR